MYRHVFRASALLALASAAVVATAADADHLQVTHRYALGGSGGWDYLSFDADARRVFITRDDHVMVVAADSGKLLGDIAGVKHAHGVAIVPTAERGYISNGHGDSVTAFDLASLRVIGEYPVSGKDPDAILFDAASDRVFAFNGHSNNVSAIDPRTGKVVATVAVPGRPEFAVGDGTGHVYVNLEDSGRLAEIDAKAAKLLTTWSLGACEGPTGLAVDIAHRRLFSVCANRQMAVLDADDGHLVATLPIGGGADAAAFDAATSTAYSSNGDGTLTVIHQDDADHYRVVTQISTAKRSKTMALDPLHHAIYLGAAAFGAAPPVTKAEPEPKGPMQAGSFALLVVGTP